MSSNIIELTARLAAIGVTPETAFHYAYCEVAERESGFISEALQKRFADIDSAFQAYVQDNRIDLRDNQQAPIETFEQWCNAKNPFPNLPHCYGLLKHYIESREPQRKLQRQTVKAFWTDFCRYWYYQTSDYVPDGRRQYGFTVINGFAREGKLVTAPRERVYINKTCLIAIHEEILSVDLCVSYRERISLLTLFAIATSTGMNLSTLLRPRVSYKCDDTEGGEVVRYVVYKCFQIWIRRDEAGGCNQIYAWIGPRGIVPGQGNVWPLTPGSPRLCASGSSMVIMSLLMDGGLDTERLAEILDPLWIPDGQEWLEYFLPQAWRDKPLFPAVNGSPLKTSKVSAWLRELSVNCGFEHYLNRYTCRDSVAHALHAERTDEQKICHLLGVKPTVQGWQGFRGRDNLFDGLAALAHQPAVSPDRQDDFKSNVTPDKKAPRQLTKEQIREVEESDELKSEAENYERLTEMPESDDDELKFARKKISQTRERLLRLRFEKARKDYFATRGSTTQNESGPQASRDFADAKQRKVHKLLQRLYQALSQPNSAALSISESLNAYQKMVEKENDAFRGRPAPRGQAWKTRYGSRVNDDDEDGEEEDDDDDDDDDDDEESLSGDEADGN
ncbi:hypothetical protein V865_001955 [Kwoniella europaea PYCC6329]|uniref:Ndc10 domain-containing protein n=1 Tax=Kwoniella europaea PYCC6329 TaxID=1423913 RepID=A0AAX4KBP3_9TREE